MLEGNITLGGYRLYAIISYIYTDTILHSEAKATQPAAAEFLQ
jgi:hypothetical protein